MADALGQALLSLAHACSYIGLDKQNFSTYNCEYFLMQQF